MLGSPYNYGKKSFPLFLLFVIFGLYLINSGLGFITLPSFILNIDKWLKIISGALLILGGLLYFMQKRYY